MNFQQQIDFLTLKVNELQNSICASKILLPNLNFSWGKANSATQVVTDYFRSTTISTIPTTVYNLRLNISNFEDIKDLNPILLIDRYKGKEVKGFDGVLGQIIYRKAGFKHEKLADAATNNRINEIPITSPEQTLNFNQENYFIFGPLSGSLSARGSSGRYLQRYDVTTGEYKSYVYLGFRLRLTINGIIKETNHLAFLKMEAFHMTFPLNSVKINYVSV